MGTFTGGVPTEFFSDNGEINVIADSVLLHLFFLLLSKIQRNEVYKDLLGNKKNFIFIRFK